MSNTKNKKLAAILFADIVGYTALMQRNEAMASTLLRHFQQQLEEKVRAHRGQIVNFYGDGALCTFPIPLDAVRCGMTLQEIFGAGTEVPVRIGIHSGTVTIEGDKVFGDSVNIASRIESMGIAGGVLLSKKVRDEVKNNPDLQLQSLGSFEFKNVTEPMEVFALANEGFTIPDPKQMKGKFKTKNNTDKIQITIAVAAFTILLLGWFGWSRWQNATSAKSAKTIAVLPFANLSAEEENEFYATGVHEDVLNKRAGLKNLRVISRTSVAKYKDHEGSLKEIGQRLGAGYVVEGSVMRLDTQVQIRVRLFDANTDESLWSDEYNSSLREVFGLQSTIAQQITNTLNTKISSKEQDQLKAVLTRTPKAYDNYIKARTILNASFVRYEKLKQAIDFLKQAVQEDAQFTDGWTLLSIALSQLYERESQFDDKEASARLLAQEAEAALAKAVQLNPESAASMRATGYYQHIVQQDEIKALRSFDKALEAFPNDFETLLYQAMMYLYMGQLESGIENLETAYSLDNENGMLNFFLARCYEFNKEYEKIPPFLEKLLQLEPEKTHYAVQAKYFQFLADGKLESFRAFEEAVRTVERTEKCDTRSVQDNEMVIAMINGEFESYVRSWSGKWDQHHRGHGNWSCPMILNDESNQARLLIDYGERKLAERIITTARQSTTRPINEKSVCIFDKTVFEPKLEFMSGDSIQARRNFEASVPKVLRNNRFPRGAVEKMVLLQTADMVAPDRVYEIYKEVTNAPVSIVGLEAICADPYTYPNLLKHPKFMEEVEADGRFVAFLQHYELNKRGLPRQAQHQEKESLEGYYFK